MGAVSGVTRKQRNGFAKGDDITLFRRAKFSGIRPDSTRRCEMTESVHSETGVPVCWLE